MIRFSVWLVSGWAHVTILLSTVIVPYLPFSKVKAYFYGIKTRVLQMLPDKLSTYCGPYIMARVPMYPLVNPKRTSATVGMASCCMRDGSRRPGMATFESRNSGRKTTRSSDSTTSKARLDFLGWTRAPKHNSVIFSILVQRCPCYE